MIKSKAEVVTYPFGFSLILRTYIAKVLRTNLVQMFYFHWQEEQTCKWNALSISKPKHTARTGTNKTLAQLSLANLVQWTEYRTGFDPECLERKIREKQIGLVNMECEFCAENEFSVQAKRKTCDRGKRIFFFSFSLLSRVGGLARRTFCACDPKSSVNAPNRPQSQVARQLFGNFCHLEQNFDL